MKDKNKINIDKLDYDIVNNTHNLSSVQVKIITKILSLIKEDKVETKKEKSFYSYTLPLSFYDFLEDDENQTKLIEEYKNLMSQVIEIYKDDGGWLFTKFFSSILYSPESKTIEHSIDGKLMPYLVELNKRIDFASINTIELKQKIDIDKC